MEILRRRLLFLWIATIFLLQKSSNVEGRHHVTKKHNNRNASRRSPAYAPSPKGPISRSPNYPPSVPSDPNDPTNSCRNCIFDVTSHGAVGDGATDDTAAFSAAWKAACQVESGIVLAPADHAFMITSTIFSGPCKPGLVFQVKIKKFLPFFTI